MKIQHPDSVIVQNLLKLRNELWEEKDPDHKVMYLFYKINSCLYRRSSTNELLKDENTLVS